MRLSPVLVLLSVLAVGCDDGPDKSSVDAVDTQGLDGLPEVVDEDAPDTTAPDTTAPDTTAPDTLEPHDTWLDATQDVLEPQDTLEDAEVPDTQGDTQAPQDTSAPDTSVADTSLPDTSVPDHCTVCLDPGLGPIGVTITNDATTEAPQLQGLLNGAGPMEGGFELRSIQVFTKGAFDGFLIQSATVQDTGETSGAVSFEGDRWTFFLDLDLTFVAQTVLGTNGGAARTPIRGGGCFTLDATMIHGDTATCGEGWPSGVTPPDELEFSHDASTGEFKLKVLLPREFVMAMIPPEYVSIAEIALTGPIRFVVTFAP